MRDPHRRHLQQWLATHPDDARGPEDPFDLDRPLGAGERWLIWRGRWTRMARLRDVVRWFGDA